MQSVTFFKLCGNESLGNFFHLRCGLRVGTGKEVQRLLVKLKYKYFEKSLYLM